MDTKDWLNQGRFLNREIRALRDALDKAEAMADFCGDTFSNTYKSRLNKKISELSRANSDIFSAIYKVDNDILRILLIERFINNKTWENVSVRLGYDFYHVVKRLYPKAVAEVDKIRH